MELKFNKYFKIIGSNITSYLLEKSRITQHDPMERNYHIFYQLVRGASPDLLRSLHLSRNTSDYFYLCKNQKQESKNLKDAETYQETIEAFHHMEFPAEAITTYLGVVAAVLHLGNVVFEETNQGESCFVADTNVDLANCADLLGVNAGRLATCLCSRTIQTGGFGKEITSVFLNRDKAQDMRDSLARNIYDKLFLDIIVKINNNNSSSPNTSQKSTGEMCIGLLDIFGFEIFEINSFEQLCM